jgi:hypothetical protein
MEQSPSAKLQFIVGDIGYAFNNDIGIFYDFIGKMYTDGRHKNHYGYLSSFACLN